MKRGGEKRKACDQHSCWLLVVSLSLCLFFFYPVGTQDQPTWPKPPDTFTTGALPTVPATAGVFRTPDPSPQVDRGRAQTRRDLESQIGKGIE